ncbi:hypothetical protein GOL24_10810 [Sinorhizobium medicae]|nr:hypothetical protein [Sinorhizobium medicae]
MSKEPSPVFYCYKALSLAPLSGNAKSAGGALLDHFNQRTGQLDPSIASLSRRLGIDRRATIDALNELVQFGLFSRRAHGGTANRSAYEPNFALARSMVSDFESRRKGAVAPSETSPLHPKNRPPKRSRRARSSGDGATTFGRQSSGNGATTPSGDGATSTSGDGATKTLRIINPHNKTLDFRSERTKPASGAAAALGQEGQAARRLVPEQCKPITGDDILLSRQMVGKNAVREAAQRRAEATGRWQRDLIRHDAELYAKLMPTLSETDVAYIEATDAELARPGGGLASILATGPPLTRRDQTRRDQKGD